MSEIFNESTEDANSNKTCSDHRQRERTPPTYHTEGIRPVRLSVHEDLSWVEGTEHGHNKSAGALEKLRDARSDRVESSFASGPIPEIPNQLGLPRGDVLLGGGRGRHSTTTTILRWRRQGPRVDVGSIPDGIGDGQATAHPALRPLPAFAVRDLTNGEGPERDR